MLNPYLLSGSPEALKIYSVEIHLSDIDNGQ